MCDKTRAEYLFAQIDEFARSQASEEDLHHIRLAQEAFGKLIMPDADNLHDGMAMLSQVEGYCIEDASPGARMMLVALLECQRMVITNALHAVANAHLAAKKSVKFSIN